MFPTIRVEENEPPPPSYEAGLGYQWSIPPLQVYSLPISVQPQSCNTATNSITTTASPEAEVIFPVPYSDMGSGSSPPHTVWAANAVPQEAGQHGAQNAGQHGAQEAGQHGAQEAGQHGAQEAGQHGAQEAQQQIFPNGMSNLTHYC